MSANNPTAVIAHHRVDASRGALLKTELWKMDCVATRNALILDGMTQIVRN
jgi:hypothetical protein